LIRIRTAQALDDLADMLIRRVQQLHHQGQEALKEYREQHQEQTDALIALLGQIVSDWQTNETPEQRLTTLTARIGDKAETIRAQCEAHMGYTGNNYLPFLPALFRSHRKTCCRWHRTRITKPRSALNKNYRTRKHPYSASVKRSG